MKNLKLNSQKNYCQVSRLLTLFSALAYLLINTATYGQVPQKFNYQGIARDVKGNPISKQTLSLKLSVLPTEDATVPEYEETQQVITNEFGLYTLQIGNGTVVSGEMKTVKWETGNKYIQVAIDPQGGTNYQIIGTSQLLSVPYAIYADKAGVARESINGGDVKTRATPKFIEMTDASGTLNQTSIIYQNKRSPALLGPLPFYPLGYDQLGIGTTSPTQSALIHVKSPGLGIQPLVLEGPALTGVHSLYRESGLNRGYFGSYVGSHAAPAYTGTVLIPSPTGTQDEDFDIGTSNGNPIGKLHLTTRTTPRITVLPTSQVGINTTTPSLTTQLDVNGSGSPALSLGGLNTPGMATGIHATANQQNVAQTQGAITGAGGITSPYVEAIGVFGEAKATGSFPNGNSIGVAGSAMLATSPQNNIGVYGEAGNALGYNTAIAGTIIQGAGSHFENAAIRGNAPIGVNSWAGIFDGKLAIRDLSEANNFVFTSDAAGTGTWMDPGTNPLVIAANANDWHLTGNAGTTVGTNFLGTTDNQDLMFKRNGMVAGRLTTDNVSYGVDANPGNLGIHNTAIGTNALTVNTADWNTAVGYNTLNANSTGHHNTANGNVSLETNTSGEHNSAYGVSSLRFNSSGSRNVAIGSAALYTNVAGNENTAIGVDAMQQNTASGNTAVGFQSLFSNTSGIHNTAIGTKSLLTNTTGQENIAVGENAMLSNTVGSENTSFGMNTLRDNMNGNWNTAVGHATMENNVSGSDNVAVGNAALQQGTATNHNTAIGIYSLQHNTADNNAALGWYSLLNNTTGTNNTAVGVSAMSTNITGSENTVVGANAQVGNASVNATALGSKAYAPNNNTVVLGSINGVNGATADAWTAVGTTAPTSKMHMQGSVSHAFKGVTAGVVDMDDHAYVGYITAGQTATYTLPAPGLCIGRVYILVNQTNTSQVVSSVMYGGVWTGYWDLFSSNQTTVPAHSSITIQSFGSGGWVQIQ